MAEEKARQFSGDTREDLTLRVAREMSALKKTHETADSKFSTTKVILCGEASTRSKERDQSQVNVRTQREGGPEGSMCIEERASQ